MNEEFRIIERKLKSKGYKITKQVADTVQMFLQHKYQHLSVEDIYIKIRETNPKIGLATVYRAVHKLYEVGVLNIFKEPAQNRNLYELKLFTKKCAHIHLICQLCGKVEEYNAPTKIYHISQKLAENKCFQLTSYEITIEGVCRKCR